MGIGDQWDPFDYRGNCLLCSSRWQHFSHSLQRLPAPLALSMLGSILLLVMLLAVSFGSISIPFSTTLQILLNGTRLFHFTQQLDSTTEVIIWQVRMPIVLGTALVGAA